MIIPRLPLGDAIEATINFLVDHFAFLTKAFSKVTESGLDLLQTGLMFIPPWLFIIIVASIVWKITKTRGITIFSVCGLLLIWNLGLWQATVSTIALVIISTLIAICCGVPIGIMQRMQPVFFLFLGSEGSGFIQNKTPHLGFSYIMKVSISNPLGRTAHWRGL